MKTKLDAIDAALKTLRFAVESLVGETVIVPEKANGAGSEHWGKPAKITNAQIHFNDIGNGEYSIWVCANVPTASGKPSAFRNYDFPLFVTPGEVERLRYKLERMERFRAKREARRERAKQRRDKKR